MKISLITLICFFVVTVANVNAQVSYTVCTPNHNAPPASPYVWPPNSTVKVYFARKMFTAEERQTLSAAMADWTQGAKSVGVHVSFVDAGVLDDVADCRGCLTVMRREVYKPTRKHYAVSYSLGRERNDLLFSAMIHLDVATTNATALRGFMSHELGHGMGLDDCKTCRKKQTIMAGFPGINRDNGLTSPSRCDLEVVRQVYERHNRTATAADVSMIPVSQP